VRSPRFGRTRGSPLPAKSFARVGTRLCAARVDVVAVVALAGAAGCVQVLGLHERLEAADGGPGGNDSVFDAASGALASTAVGQCGQLTHASASCASCMDLACCAEARACAGDPACHEASDCLASCADAACRARCTDFYAQPDTLISLRSCRVRQCGAACGSRCGEFAPSPISACEACQEASCCTQGTACASDGNCGVLSRCINNCFGVAASCPTDCQAKYPEGAATYGSWVSCTSNCATACAPGLNWACLDKPILWPKPKAVGTIAISVTFVTFTTEEPFVGASVKACGKLDFTCANPLDHATTDATGLVSLTVPAGLSGFDGYLDIAGGKVAGSDAGAFVFPAIWYPVPFIVADGWRGRTQLLADDEFQAIMAATGTVIDPARGTIAVNAVDCLFGPAAGVSFVLDSADSKTVSYYLVGGQPATAATATDQSGISAFVNIPTNGNAHLAVVKAFSGAAGGKSMGALTFIVRPGTATYPSLFPPVP
jgi:hypothetical protein